MIYLHGGGQRGQDLTKLDAYGPPKLIKEGRNFDFIIASHQCPEDKYWSTDNWFEPLYAKLLSRYQVDKKRVYLTGISMGGYGTWQTAVAYPYPSPMWGLRRLDPDLYDQSSPGMDISRDGG